MPIAEMSHDLLRGNSACSLQAMNCTLDSNVSSCSQGDVAQCVTDVEDFPIGIVSSGCLGDSVYTDACPSSGPQDSVPHVLLISCIFNDAILSRACA